MNHPSATETPSQTTHVPDVVAKQATSVPSQPPARSAPRSNNGDNGGFTGGTSTDRATNTSSEIKQPNLNRISSAGPAATRTAVNSDTAPVRHTAPVTAAPVSKGDAPISKPSSVIEEHGSRSAAVQQARDTEAVPAAATTAATTTTTITHSAVVRFLFLSYHPPSFSSNNSLTSDDHTKCAS